MMLYLRMSQNSTEGLDLEVMCSFEHGNKNSDSINSRKCFDHLNDHEFFKDSAL
jgi:hypothetical protein